MRDTRWRTLIAAALILLASLPLAAQRAGEAVQVTVIEVPVTVVDRAGNPVRNLTKDDFELFDDGKKVPIEYFEVVDLARVSAEAGSAQALPPAATRNFLLLFDFANSSPGTIGRAAEAAKEFVDTQIGPRDLAAVSTFTTEQGARMVTGFTNSKKLLNQAIETLGNPNYFRVADPLMISAIVSSGSDDASGRAGEARGSIDAAIKEQAEDHQRAAQTSRDSEMKNRLRIQLNNFGSVARSLERLQGQKQIILLSEGFDARLVQGREEINREQTQKDTDAVLSGEVWNVDNEQRFGSASSSRDVNDMVALFRRSDVVLHAIDIRGLRSEVDARDGARRTSNESLFLLTTPTGGSVFKNANDLTTNFARMLKQQENVYVLGFTARSTGKPGKFHDLRVRTKERGARVSHRPGYTEPGTRITDLERALTLGEIITADLPIEDIRVSLVPVALPGPGGKARVPVVVELSGSTLLTGVEGNAATANLYLYAFNEENEVVDFLQQRISLDLVKAGDAVRGSGVRYFGTLKLPPGDFAIKSLVRVEESGRIGFRRSNLTVPTFETATVLPPLLFGDPSNWITLTGPTRGDEYAYPFSAGETTYVPRSSQLDKGAEYTVALILYRVSLADLQVSPTLVSGNGSSSTPAFKLLGRTAADDRGAVKLLFTLNTEGIETGDHTLQLTVKAKDGTESIVSLPFRVL
ncbi:MAG TPA: VWA domain-containing protein [Thermoanaerobaculia bacterium]